MTKVYDQQQHEDFVKWYFSKTHKVLTKSEIERTRGNFTYDIEYYLSLPNLSTKIQIIDVHNR